MDTAMLFHFGEYEYIAEHLCALPCFGQGQFAITRYENQELHGHIGGSVSGKCCAILGSIAPPDTQIAAFTLLAHTLKKEEASHVLGIIPYLAYMREDKYKARESRSTAWAGCLLRSSGIDRVVTVDLHSDRDKELLSVPLISLSPAALFASTIAQLGWKDATIVAPDDGAVARCEAVKSAMGVFPGSIPYFEKQRTNEGIIRGRFIGETGTRAILVDDILDTGNTLVSACEKLIESNVREICIFVTHGLFTGTYWKRLRSLSVKHIFCTDTIPACRNLIGTDITVISISPLLKRYFGPCLPHARQDEQSYL